MLLIFIEAGLFVLMLFFILYFKVLSRTQLGEREIGPYFIAYRQNLVTVWAIPVKIREIQKYLTSKKIKADTFITIYLADPTKSGKPMPCIIGAIINESDGINLEEPYKTMTLTPRHVATAASANRIIGLNKKALYPQLKAYMNIHGYTNVADEYIEIYHMGKGNGFGGGYYTEVCTRIRQQSEEELLATEKHENRGMNAASILFGGKGRFGKGD